jgi:hypothetical protein
MAWTMLLCDSRAAAWASQLQPLQELRLGRQPGLEHLDRDQPVHAHLPGRQHRPGRPLAELGQKLVVRDRLGGYSGNSCSSRRACVAVTRPAWTSRSR